MNKVKIGVIGAGWWATENHIPHLAERDEVELTSVCKLEEDQLSSNLVKFALYTQQSQYSFTASFNIPFFLKVTILFYIKL